MEMSQVAASSSDQSGDDNEKAPSMISDADVDTGANALQPLARFELSTFDNDTEYITSMLHGREDDLRERYNALFGRLKGWVSEGLHKELEYAART